MSVEFRYFAHPHEFAHYSSEPATCEFCGERRAHYTGPFYGLDRDRKIICEVCLIGGRLEPLDMATNSGNRSALRRQLADLHPEMAETETERIVRERSAEVETRTPGFLSWQELDWPAHCGDYCRYIKEIGQPELVALAPDGDGPAYLSAHAPDINDIEFARDIWKGIRPDAPADNTTCYSTEVFLFSCLVCSEHVIWWDCD